MIIGVSLKNLNTKVVPFISNDLEVAFCKNSHYEIVGTCIVYQDDQNNYYAELNLNSEISDSLYFYYRTRANNAGIYVFAGLDLMENELPDQPTVRLKDVILI